MNETFIMKDGEQFNYEQREEIGLHQVTLDEFIEEYKKGNIKINEE